MLIQGAITLLSSNDLPFLITKEEKDMTTIDIKDNIITEGKKRFRKSTKEYDKVYPKVEKSIDKVVYGVLSVGIKAEFIAERMLKF